MSVQTSPSEIQRTLDQIIASESRARILRMVDRLKRQYDERLRKVVLNERLQAYELALHRHSPPAVVALFRERLIEAGGAVHLKAEAEGRDA